MTEIVYAVPCIATPFTALPPPPALDPVATALFLDLDGTVAEIEPRPQDVGPDAERTRVLTDLCRRMPGQVALLTGRTLEEADRILDGALAAVAAVHGLVRRLPDGAIASFRPSDELDFARRTLTALAKGQQGLIVEEKLASVALHYRQNPGVEDAVRDATALLSRATELVVQNGAMVSEMRTAGPNKGDSLQAFMGEAPFAGRMPIAIGDDLTDEFAFAAAEALGGYGVLVGEPRDTRARYGLGSVDEVLAWLRSAA